MGEDKAQELFEAISAANWAVAWVEAGGDDAGADDVDAMDLTKAKLLAALTKKVCCP